jgi:TatA/E family protein of Tat protein translocase
MLSVPHLIIIFAVALVVFGPQKLPELARTLGKLMADFRRVTGDLRSTFDEHMRELDREAQVLESRKRELDAREAAMKASPMPPAAVQLPDAPPPPVAEPPATRATGSVDTAGAVDETRESENRIGGGLAREAAPPVPDTIPRAKTSGAGSGAAGADGNGSRGVSTSDMEPEIGPEVAPQPE